VVGTSAVPLAFAFLGYGLRATSWTEPYRFVVPATVALAFPAAIGLAEGPGRWMSAWRRIWPWASPALALGLCLWSPISPSLPIRSGLSGEARGLVALLRSRVDPERRLLLEDSAWELPESDWIENLSAPGHRYFGTHLPSLLPELTGLELLNGAYVGAPFIRHQTVRFESRRLDGRPIGEWSAAELRVLFDRYAVGHVLVWSDEARAALRAQPGLLAPDGALEELSLFRVMGPSSRFALGSGRVRSSLERLELDELEPEKGRVVIRYHFDSRLRSEPPLTVERVPVEGDPIGFIGLRDPPRHLRLGFQPLARSADASGWPPPRAAVHPGG
jgi:hypothetical protein